MSNHPSGRNNSGLASQVTPSFVSRDKEWVITLWPTCGWFVQLKWESCSEVNTMWQVTPWGARRSHGSSDGKPNRNNCALRGHSLTSEKWRVVGFFFIIISALTFVRHLTFSSSHRLNPSIISCSIIVPLPSNILVMVKVRVTVFQRWFYKIRGMHPI